MEDYYHGQRRTTYFLRNEGFIPSDIHLRLTAVCEEKASASNTVYNWVRNLSSSNATAQESVREWYRNITTKWFHEATRKLQRRRECCVT